jgi:hypothetical protein
LVAALKNIGSFLGPVTLPSIQNWGGTGLGLIRRNKKDLEAMGIKSLQADKLFDALQYLREEGIFSIFFYFFLIFF